MSSWYGIFELCSDFIEAWLCYHYIGIFLPDRVRGRLPFFLLSMVLISSVRVMNAYQVDPLISTLWFVFYICMTTVVLFQVDLFYAVSLVSFYILCLYIINFFCMSVMGVMAGNRQFAQFILNQLSLSRCVYLAADKAMLFLYYLLSRRCFKGKMFYNPRMMFTISLFGMLGVGFLSLTTLKEISVLTMFSWGLFLVLLLCFYFVMRFYSNYVKEREMRSILELKDQLVRHEYETVKQMQKEQEILSHNMKNHLLILGNMLRDSRTLEASAYISQLSAPLEQLSPSLWTGVPTLDVLLNHTQNRCNQTGVDFTVQADALDLHLMEDRDICSLFSNLLDNAYEAAVRMPAGQGWVLVKIRRMKEMIFIDISNSAPNAPCRKNGRLISRKTDSRLHGIGLNSASISAQKYGGQLEHTYENGVFTVKVNFLGGIRPLSPAP